MPERKRFFQLISSLRTHHWQTHNRTRISKHVVEATVNNIMQGVIHYKCDATNNNAIASVLVLRQHVRREAVIIIILLVVTTTVKVLERFQQFKNACNSFVGRVFPNLQQKCYFYDNIGNARISKAPGPATPSCVYLGIAQESFDPAPPPRSNRHFLI